MSPASALIRTQRTAPRLALSGLHAVWLCALVGLPLQASTAQTASAPFAAQFDGIVEPLAPDMAEIDPLTPPSAVDLGSFDPPVEQPATARSLGSGVASYYASRFHGRPTASGERFDMGAMTAAHRTLPFGSLVRVTNPANGRSVTVRINDRGPFTRGRVIDVSQAAARELGMIASGHAPVELELLTS